MKKAMNKMRVHGKIFCVFSCLVLSFLYISCDKYFQFYTFDFTFNKPISNIKDITLVEGTLTLSNSEGTKTNDGDFREFVNGYYLTFVVDCDFEELKTEHYIFTLNFMSGENQYVCTIEGDVDPYTSVIDEIVKNSAVPKHPEFHATFDRCAVFNR